MTRHTPRIVRQPRITSPLGDVLLVCFAAVLICGALGAAFLVMR